MGRIQTIDDFRSIELEELKALKPKLHKELLNFCSELDQKEFPEAATIATGKTKSLRGFGKLYEKLLQSKGEKKFTERLKKAEKMILSMSRLKKGNERGNKIEPHTDIERPGRKWGGLLDDTNTRLAKPTGKTCGKITVEISRDGEKQKLELTGLEPRTIETSKGKYKLHLMDVHQASAVFFIETLVIDPIGKRTWGDRFVNLLLALKTKGTAVAYLAVGQDVTLGDTKIKLDNVVEKSPPFFVTGREPLIHYEPPKSGKGLKSEPISVTSEGKTFVFEVPPEHDPSKSLMVTNDRLIIDEIPNGFVVRLKKPDEK